MIKKAELRTFASESEHSTEVEIRIEGSYSADELEHALATGKNHLRHGKKVYLLSRDLKEKASRIQRRVSANPDAPLLARSSHPIEKFQAPGLEDFLLEADPRFQTPAKWKKRSSALRNLSGSPRPVFREPLMPPFVPIKRLVLLGFCTSSAINSGNSCRRNGFGKTLQTLAFISTLRQEDALASVSLVVCPASLLENWKRKLKNSAPNFPLTFIMGATEPTMYEKSVSTIS